jgi:hypothetical protein
MTLMEIEAAVLSLPEPERESLARKMLASLRKAPLTPAEEQELEALRARLEPQLEEWFSGPAEPMTEEDWESLFRGEYKHPPVSKSPAVPAGWESPRLKGG